MFAVIFTVQPKKERWNDYLDLAKFLKPKLEAVDGFIDNERFESKRTKGRLLSLSTWRDEKAVVRWRTQGEHHGAQTKGRFEIFEDYHLSVGEITATPTRRKGWRSKRGGSTRPRSGGQRSRRLRSRATEAISPSTWTHCRRASVSAPIATASSTSRCSRASIIRASS